jgi:hypothetical protein
VEYKGETLPDDLFIKAKKDGFADKYLAKLLGVNEKVLQLRRADVCFYCGNTFGGIYAELERERGNPSSWDTMRAHIYLKIQRYLQ